MDKDQVEGKLKEVAGRVQRKAGEWTGDTENQVEGAKKQAAGKVQNAWGKAKDAADASRSEGKPPQRESSDQENEESASPRRTGS